MTKIPRSVFATFAIGPCANLTFMISSAMSSPNHTRPVCLSMSTCSTLMASKTTVRTSTASFAFSIFLQIFGSSFLHLTPQKPLSAVYWCSENIFLPPVDVALIYPCIRITVAAPCIKNLSACDAVIDAAAATAALALCCIAAGLSAGHFPSVPSSRNFIHYFNF